MGSRLTGFLTWVNKAVSQAQASFVASRISSQELPPFDENVLTSLQDSTHIHATLIALDLISSFCYLAHLRLCSFRSHFSYTLHTPPFPLEVSPKDLKIQLL